MFLKVRSLCDRPRKQHKEQKSDIQITVKYNRMAVNAFLYLSHGLLFCHYVQFWYKRALSVPTSRQRHQESFRSDRRGEEGVAPNSFFFVAYTHGKHTFWIRFMQLDSFTAFGMLKYSAEFIYQVIGFFLIMEWRNSFLQAVPGRLEIVLCRETSNKW